MQSVLDKLEENNIMVIFVPPNCTDLLQLLDVSVNKPLKAEIKKRFVSWYSDKVQQQLNDGTPIQEVNVSMQMSRMKTLATQWLVGAFDYVQNNEQFVVNGFKRTGIFELLIK